MRGGWRDEEQSGTILNEQQDVSNAGGNQYRDYGFTHGMPSHMHKHFMPRIIELAGDLRPGIRVLDVGCGNGYTASQFVKRGCEVVGVDLSESGIEQARTASPDARFEVLAADTHILENLRTRPFDLVICTEVIEHLYSPRQCIRGCYAALEPGGRLICSTPYHGYFKNLAIALTNKFDSHVSPLWEGGHIKFWSRKTLTRLLVEEGFTDLRFYGAGRLPFLWMTMILVAFKPPFRGGAS